MESRRFKSDYHQVMVRRHDDSPHTPGLNVPQSGRKIRNEITKSGALSSRRIGSPSGQTEPYITVICVSGPHINNANPDRQAEGCWDIC